nr:MAG: hypothetical protein [Bacteriophage sp.]
MSQSKTYLKFKETRSQEDLETLNSYLKRLSEISDILNGDEDLDNETENKLYDEDDPHYDDMVNYSADMLWVYTYADKESLELDLMDILNQMDLLRGCDDQYFDYNVDEVDMVLYGATIIQEQEKYKPLIMQKFQHYKDNFDEEEHAEEIDYYLNFLEEPETLYTFTEKTINLFKSFIHEN